jgi:ABC transporter DrrB family efflux protein
MTHLLSRRPVSGRPVAGRPVSHRPGPERLVRGRIVSGRIVIATARRVLAQLRGDRRTVALLLVVPSLLLVLTNQMFDAQPAFDRVALSLLGIFPFTTMYLVTSVSMLRERTSGTLERLLTTPMAKLDLLLGYGVAFAVAAAAQAAVTCGTAYWLLGLYTPGSPWLVVATAILGAVLGMALGLLSSAFATTEFQAVQFMPAIVMPQILLGGLFIPREEMADWLQTISNALPLTYSIDALSEVGRTSLLTDTLLRDLGVVAGTAFAALVLGAFTLRRRAGTLRPAARRALLVVPLVGVAVGGAWTATHLLGEQAYVTTDDARIDGDAIVLRAPATGTLIDWNAGQGSILRRDEPIGRIRINGGFGRPTQIIRAPGDGTVVVDSGFEGNLVTAGAELAVAYDLSAVRVTAPIDETAIGDVHVGQPVDIDVDAYPDVTFAGTVQEIHAAAARQPSAEETTGRFRPTTQVVPVDIAILDRAGYTLIPGMNATVRIRQER